MTRLSVLLSVLLLTASCAHERAPLTPPTAAPPLLETVPVDAVTPPDAGMLALMAPYRSEVVKLDNPIGRSAVTMKMERTETPLGYWIADILRERASAINGGPVDVAFYNVGGIRADLPEGDVSYTTISKILPFDNTIVIIPCSGAQLLQIAEYLATTKGSYPISGMSIAASAEKKVEQVLVGGKPLDPEGKYVAATNNFLANGAGGMDFLKDYSWSDTGVFVRDAVVEHVKALGLEGKEVQLPESLSRYTYGGKKVEELPE